MYKFLQKTRLIFCLIIQLESDLQLQDRCFHFEEAAYSHHLKIEIADEIRTCGNQNFQNEYLDIILITIIYFQDN